MTVQNTIVKNTYSGNGSTTVFPYTFALNEEDGEFVQVFVADESDSESEVTNFLIDTEEQTVTYPYPSGDPLPEGHRIALKRVLPNKQELNLENQGPFFAEDIEDQLDRIVMMVQQIAEENNRAIKVNVTSEQTADQLMDHLEERAAAAELAAANASTSETNAYNSAEAASGSAAAALGDRERADEILRDIEAAAQTVGGIATVYDPDKTYAPASQVMVENGDTYRCIRTSRGEYPPDSGKWVITAIGKKDTFERDDDGDLVPCRYAQASAMWDIDEDGDIVPRHITE